jgi:hypothetical protein
VPAPDAKATSPRAALALRVLAAALLGVDCYVHLHLAPTYATVGTTLTQQDLFVVEGVVAGLAGVAVLGSDHRLVWLVAGMVGFGGLAAVLLYRYVAVPGFGPVPGMYEPAWYAEKTLSALAEGGVGVLWLIRRRLRHVRRGG